MKRALAAAAFVAGALHGIACADERFERVQVFLERNMMDKDVEIKFEAVGGAAGLTSLKVLAPDRRTVIDFKAPDSKLGLRHLTFESPEPPNNGTLQADFPAGIYTFSGSSPSGGGCDCGNTPGRSWRVYSLTVTRYRYSVMRVLSSIGAASSPEDSSAKSHPGSSARPGWAA